MKVISGGQTGVDRGALDAAIELQLPHGGWCPLGRRAEDGRISERYALVETESPDGAVRTERNVVNSDATLILYRGDIQGGTALTLQMARRHGRPYRLVDLNNLTEPKEIRRWLDELRAGTLNVAGPRESQCPGITIAAKEFLVRVFRP